jgi:hypothetical protein
MCNNNNLNFIFLKDTVIVTVKKGVLLSKLCFKEFLYLIKIYTILSYAY